MAFITVDYDPENAKNAAAGGGQTLPPGWYVWQIQSFEHKGATEPGKHGSIVCKCEIRQSFSNANLGKKITVRFQRNPNSVPYNLMPFLRAAGIPFQDNGGGSIGFDDSLLNGAIVKSVCKITPGDSRNFENWENFEPAGGPAQVAPQAAPAFQPPPQNNWGPQVQQQWAPPPQQQPQQTWGSQVVQQQHQQHQYQQSPQQQVFPQQTAPMQQPFQGQPYPQGGTAQPFQQQPPMTWGQQPMQQPQNGQNGQYVQPQQPQQGQPPPGWPAPTGR